MKRFINTGFFLSIRSASPEVDVRVLENEYDEFASFLFSERKAFASNEAYCNALLYTMVELNNLAVFSEKKTA